MHALFRYVLGGLVLFCVSCRSSDPIVYWKPNTLEPSGFTNIMVVAILPGEDSALRVQIEQAGVLALQKKGVQAVASSTHFGLHGFADLTEESTFRKLCENGIDAVFSVAMVSTANSSRLRGAKAFTSPSLHFYERIWKYRGMYGNDKDSAMAEPLSWEAILFDLLSLRPAIVLSSRNQSRATAGNGSKWIVDAVKKLDKQKILSRSTIRKKAF